MNYNLAYFTDTYYPQLNGLVTSIDSFKEHLERRGNKVRICAPKDNELDREDKDVFRFRSVPYPFYKEFKVSWPYTRKLKQFNEFKTDIYHLQTPFSLGLLGMFLAKKQKAPVILTYHSLWTEYVHYVPLPKKAVQSFAIRLSQQFCNQLDLVIVPSNAMKKEVESYGLDTEITTIPTGFSFEHVNQDIDLDIRETYKIPTDHKILVFVGRIGNEKNIHLLIDSFKEVFNIDRKVHLLVIGQGPELDSCIAQADSYNLSSHITFTGRKPYDEVISMLRKSDIFVFPSVSETQGMVSLEALACGLPVVAVNRMGTIDYLSDGKGGLLTEPTVADFSKGIISVLRSKNVDQMRRDALAKANLYTMEKMTDRLVETYDRVYSEHQAKIKKKSSKKQYV